MEDRTRECLTSGRTTDKIRVDWVFGSLEVQLSGHMCAIDGRSINRSQRASRLRLSGAQTTWNKTLFDVALWADNWQLPRAKQNLVGKENLNTSTVLDDLLYFQVVLSGQLMCLSHASLRLDEVYYFSALVHNITRNTPTFLSSCYPGTQTLLFLTQGNDGLWHGNTENPVRSCLKLWNINVSLGKTCHCEKCLKD